MLRHLKLHDFALVKDLELEPGEGLCLLTGETGAGKSILVGAVGLLSGQRAETEMVRDGSDEAVVEGSFHVQRHAPEVSVLLEQWSLPFDGEVIIRRRVLREGRNAITVNGGAVTLAQLKDLGAHLVQVHGQNQGQSLLDENVHRSILDGLPEVSPAAKALELSFEELEQALRLLRGIQRSESERAQRLDTVVLQRGEIDRVGPSPGEEDEHLIAKTRLQNAEAIAEAANSVASLLRDDEASVASQLAEARRRLRDLGEMDPSWTPYLKDLEDSAAVLATIASEAERTASTVSHDPAALEGVLQRIADLDRLKKKYGPSLDEVLAHRNDLEEEYAELTGRAVSVAEALKRLDGAFASYQEAASALSRLRAAAARSFSTSVERALHPLAMDKARFQVTLLARQVEDPKQAGRFGNEDVRFLFSANPGEPPKALSKIASGGELSRCLLALLTVAGAGTAPDTLVFDEVDAGIGGRPAERVGRSLWKLASNHQVLCITHLPQIAAFSHWHAKVEKAVHAGRTVVSARVLSEAEKADEIARMLAGETINETARQHALQLMKMSEESK
jgi:DNA repair protein RecN (Recombination protein N)